MIIISLSVYCLLTMPPLKQSNVLKWINNVCLTFFTIEFLLRIVVCPRKREFVKDYKNWIDFLSIIPSYLMLAFPDKRWITNLVIIRLLRVFKFFKLSYGLQVLLHTLKASSYELTLLLLILLIPLVVFSSLVYAFEHSLDEEKTDFDSIPRTFWWTIVTMTTVGYGDLAPKTWPGQLIGSLCAIISVLIIALPISVIGNNFNLYYAHVRARLKLPKKNRHLLQGRLRGLLRQPAMLSSRDRDRKCITRRSNGGGSLHATPNCNDSRLTVDHARSPSPFLQLQKRRPPVLEQQISSGSSDEDDTKKTEKSALNSPCPPKGLLAATTKSCLQNTTNDNKLSNPKNDNNEANNLKDVKLSVNISPPSPVRTPQNSPLGKRKRKANIQENIMNDFPTRSRRSAVGIAQQSPGSSSSGETSMTGSTDSIILPSISLAQPTLLLGNGTVVVNDEQNDKGKNPRVSENINNIKVNHCTALDDLVSRRESMKFLDYSGQCLKNSSHIPIKPKRSSVSSISPAYRSRSNTLEHQRMNNHYLKRQSSVCESIPGSPLLSNKARNSSSPLLINHGNNDFVKPALRKISYNKEQQQKKNLSIHNNNNSKRRPLRRSATENSFIPVRQQENNDTLKNHSLSIDDIMGNKGKRVTTDEKAPFLRESGV